MNEYLEIGQKVTWKINDFKLAGVVIQDLEDGIVETLIHSRNNMVCTQKVNVKKELLTKVN